VNRDSGTDRANGGSGDLLGGIILFTIICGYPLPISLLAFFELLYLVKRFREYSKIQSGKYRYDADNTQKFNQSKSSASHIKSHPAITDKVA
jgi:hypothetical protein